MMVVRQLFEIEGDLTVKITLVERRLISVGSIDFCGRTGADWEARGNLDNLQLP